MYFEADIAWVIRAKQPRCLLRHHNLHYAAPPQYQHDIHEIAHHISYTPHVTLRSRIDAFTEGLVYIVRFSSGVRLPKDSSLARHDASPNFQNNLPLPFPICTPCLNYPKSALATRR
jgi:hypothetical protein